LLFTRTTSAADSQTLLQLLVLALQRVYSVLEAAPFRSAVGYRALLGVSLGHHLEEVAAVCSPVRQLDLLVLAVVGLRTEVDALRVAVELAVVMPALADCALCLGVAPEQVLVDLVEFEHSFGESLLLGFQYRHLMEKPFRGRLQRGCFSVDRHARVDGDIAAIQPKVLL
jgi:hypothetical protein